jgi:hypothetical protein
MRIGLAAPGLLVLLATGTASAQYNPNAYRPTAGSYAPFSPVLSPYLDLTRGGNPAVNYFLGTLPEIDRRATQARQGAAILDLDRRLEAPPPGEPLLPTDVVGEVTKGALPPTGHAAVFTNYSTYYGLTAPTFQPQRTLPTTGGRVR